MDRSQKLKLLYIGCEASESKLTGRENLSRSIKSILQEMDADVVICELPRSKKDGSVVRQLMGALGFIDGVSPKSIGMIKKVIQEADFDIVLVDGSNLGLLSRAIRRLRPRARIFGFCHNCETKFFADAFRAKARFRSFMVLVANAIAERAMMRSADHIICLTDRDSRDLHKYHHRNADYIQPMFLSEIDDNLNEPPLDRAPYCLFVGGAFFANIESGQWITDTLSSQFPLDILIVGQGMELYASKWNNRRVTVVGGVSSVAPYYKGAAFVIAPVFSGSGMKTKVAEALQFGKLTLASDEALIGYDDLPSDQMVRCNTRLDYISAAGRVLDGTLRSDPSAMRSTFATHYSRTSALENLDQVFRAELIR